MMPSKRSFESRVPTNPDHRRPGERPRALRRRSLALVVTAATTCAVIPAFAQAPRPAAPPARPAGQTPAEPAKAGAPPGAAIPGGSAATTTPSGAVIPDVNEAKRIEDLTEFREGGLTADQTAVRAMQTSYNAKAQEEAMRAAVARADAQWASYLPRLTGKASYTRLSNLTPPDISFGGTTFSGSAISPVLLNNTVFQAMLTVPISDYFLRIGQAYSAATRSEEASRFDYQAARAKSYSDGKIAYFTWLRGRGAVIVTTQTLAVAQAHLKDAENQFAVGNASKADVLRAQTQLAASELQVERAKSVAIQAERQVRVAMHLKDEEVIVPGDRLDAPLPPVAGNIRGLIDEAVSQRAELKSLEKNVEASRKLATVQRAGRYPVISGFGEVTYANPNNRRFPIRDEFFPTWSVGAQLTWTPNDILTANAGGHEQESRADQLEAQKQAVRDGIEMEVVQSFQSAVEADVALQTTTRQLESAIEGYRVARELFNNGRGTGTTVIDAENALATTRLDYLNARVDSRMSRVRLEHALGRDLKAVGTGP